MAMALKQEDLEVTELGREWNFPIHDWIPADPPAPCVIHYHGCVEPTGLIAATGVAAVDAVIVQLNDAISSVWHEAFPNETFWNWRYKSNPLLGSGIGSRGKALRGKRRLLTKVVERIQPRRVVEVDATFGRIRVFDNDLLAEQIRDFGAHTRPELAFLMSIVEATDLIFDLGAHIVSFALPIGRRVERGNVAVEGMPPYFDLLAWNVEANELSEQVVPVLAILAPQGRSFVAAEDARNSGATHFMPRRPWQRRSGAPTTSVDELVDAYGRPKVIKIDVEGLELDLLQDSEFVSCERPILYTEVASAQLARYSRTVEEFNDFLHDLRYRLYRNVGERNGAHDRFSAVEVRDLTEVPEPLFDVLALPADCPRRAIGGDH